MKTLIPFVMVLLGLAGCPAAEAPARLDVDGQIVDTQRSPEVSPKDIAEKDTNPPDVSPDVAPEVSSDLLPDVPVSDVSDVSPVDVPADVVPVDHMLVDHTLWIQLKLVGDPFYQDGDPSPDLCPESEVKLEDTPTGIQIEVDTTFCAYLTLRQPLLAPVPKGAKVRVVISHGAIYDGDADYWMAVAMGDPAQTVWEHVTAIPSLDNVFEMTWESPADFEAGAPVFFHISNHGDNQWALRDLIATY